MENSISIVEKLRQMKDADVATEKIKIKEEEEEIKRKVKLKEEKKKQREEKKAQKEKEYKEWEIKMNNATKPWTNEGRAYTDEEFKMAIEGDHNNERHLISVGKRLGRKATAINVLIEFRNRCLKDGEIPKNFWGQSISGGEHDMPDKLDNMGDQYKRIVLGDMEDYYRRFI